MIYVCNPNNPTGTICNRNALVSFIREASKKTLVVIDEAYLDYTQELSVSNLIPDNERIIIVKTFSKIYGMAGARIGYALGHAKTIEQLESGSNMGISAVSLAGALAALQDKTFVKESYALNEQARAYTIEQLTRLHIDCIPSYTNFIYFSLEKYGKDFFSLLKANNIQGTEIFEPAGKWSRVTVGTLQEMQQFIKAVS